MPSFRSSAVAYPSLPDLAVRVDTGPFHLVADVDESWIPASGDGDSLRRLESFLGCRAGVVLTLVTRRPLESALRLLQEWGVLMPDHLVTDMGTAVHHQDAAGRWAEDRAYAGWVATRWDPGLKERLSRGGLPAGVQFQWDMASPHRLALETLPGHDLAQAAGELRLALAALGSYASVVASGTRWLDVLPPGVDRGTPVAFMANRWGLPRPLVACGHSADDLDLLQLADVAMLMPGSGPAPALAGRMRVASASRPGPGGILEALMTLEAGAGALQP